MAAGDITKTGNAFQPLYGLNANLNSLAKKAGQFIITDVGEQWFDVDASTRIKIGVFDSVANLAALEDEGISTSKVYYVRDVKALAVYNSSKSQWEQINADTGATSVAFSGDVTSGVPNSGTCITGASYSAANRTITFTVAKLDAANITYNTNSTVDAALGTLMGDNTTAGSVAKAEKDAKDYADGLIAALDTSSDVTVVSKSGKAITITADIAEENGVIKKGAGTDITLADVASTGKAEDVEYTTGVSVKSSLDTITGSASTAGSIAKAEADAKSYADGLVDGLEVTEFALAEKDSDTNVITIHGISESDGEIAVGVSSANDITLAAVAATGDAENVTYDNTTSGLTATDVQAAIDEVAAASAGGVESKTIYLHDDSAGQSTYAKVYNLYQGTNDFVADRTDGKTNPALVGTINIAKDKFVKSGSVVQIVFKSSDNTLHEGTESGTDVTALIKGDTTPTAADAGAYIKIELQNETNPLYIAASDLVDVYTAAQSATQVQVAVNDGVISASIVAGSVDSTALGTGAVTTVKIADDAVTADKVAISAHTESQTAGADGIAVSVTTTDGQVSAVSASIAANTYDAYGAASTAKSEVIGANTDASTDNTIYGAKAYADSAASTAASTAIAALDADLDASGTAAHSGTFVVSGVTEVDGVLTAVDSVEVETAGAAAAVQSAVIGTSSDAASADTINGAKAYADSQIQAAQLTWGTF